MEGGGKCMAGFTREDEESNVVGKQETWRRHIRRLLREPGSAVTLVPRAFAEYLRARLGGK